MGFITMGAMILGFGFIIFSITLGGNIMDFVNMESVMITIGGTLCATIMSFPFSQITAAVKSVKFVFKKVSFDPKNDIEQIVNMATIARKGGLLALENETEAIDNAFFRKGVMLVVDGSNSELVKSVMETEIDNIYTRHEDRSTVYRRAASYAPAFGMIGTLIGLINMLQVLQDPTNIGPKMGVALITTFYGTIMANLIFMPIAVKLDSLNDNEALRNRIFLEGILSIQVGENPRIIREKLRAFIPNDEYSSKKRRKGGAEDRGEE